MAPREPPRVEPLLVVEFSPAADAALRKLARKSPLRARSVIETVKVVRGTTWSKAVHSRLIRMLRKADQVAEIRDMAEGMRIIFFWDDTASGRVLYVTGIHSKGVLKKRRLQALAKSAAAVRKHWERTGEF
jgi:hypothetical protein